MSKNANFGEISSVKSRKRDMIKAEFHPIQKKSPSEENFVKIWGKSSNYDGDIRCD